MRGGRVVRNGGGRSSLAALLQWLLAVAGLMCLLAAAIPRVRTALVEWRVRTEMAREMARAAADPHDIVLEPPAAVPPPPAPAPLPDAPLPPGAVVGYLKIPRLRLTSAILEGDDNAVLSVAAGHLSDTPYPWQAGNAAVSAHRDGIFRALRNVRAGDRIDLWTTRGVFAYRVRRTLIVAPDALWVLSPPETDVGLTLITCFPFYYVGPAPKRFIVQAERVSLPDADAPDALEDSFARVD